MIRNKLTSQKLWRHICVETSFKLTVSWIDRLDTSSVQPAVRFLYGSSILQVVNSLFSSKDIFEGVNNLKVIDFFLLKIPILSSTVVGPICVIYTILP